MRRSASSQCDADCAHSCNDYCGVSCHAWGFSVKCGVGHLTRNWGKPMAKGAIAFLLAATFLGGCKNSPDKSGGAAVVEAALPVYSEPPTIDAGLSVEQAYAAMTPTPTRNSTS